MEYLEYLELAWKYFPYVFYTFVFLTFLPKSLRKIKNFADANYAANRNKYHRCYGPELCCHALIDHDDRDEMTLTKQKPRKPVTRAYLRKQQQQSSQRANSIDDAMTPVSIKRQVQASAIQTQTNVNQIAKMFESGSGLRAQKKINRVLPEIRTSMYRSIDAENSDTLDEQQAPYKKIAHLLQENIENSMNLLHQQNTNELNSNSNSNGNGNGNSKIDNVNDLDAVDVDHNGEWLHSDATLSNVVLQRRTRAIPNTLSYAAGTSATPSTASPAASSPHSSPTSNSPVQPSSPILRTAPILNLKTSVEDIFAAIARSAEHNEEQFIYNGCNTLSPVTSIDDILAQRRLSRPLSAYSISDLLNEETTTTARIIADGNDHHHAVKDDKNSQYVECLLNALDA